MKIKAGPTKATKPKDRPFTVTFDGELAEKLRTGARQLGQRPATFARQCAQSGELLSSPTKQGDEFRRLVYQAAIRGEARA